MMAKKVSGSEDTFAKSIDSWCAKKIGNFVSNKFDLKKKSLRLQVAKKTSPKGDSRFHFEIVLQLVKYRED